MEQKQRFSKDDFYAIGDLVEEMYNPTQPDQEIVQEEYFSDVEDEAEQMDGDLDMAVSDAQDEYGEYEAAESYPPEFENKTSDRPFPYLIKTYNQDRLKNVDVVWLHKPDLSSFDEEVPFMIGSNQELLPIQD